MLVAIKKSKSVLSSHGIHPSPSPGSGQSPGSSILLVAVNGVGLFYFSVRGTRNEDRSKDTFHQSIRVP